MHQSRGKWQSNPLPTHGTWLTFPPSLKQQRASKNHIINILHQHEVLTEHISWALKLAATALNYPSLKGIPITLIDIHSLCSGGANALALCGYSDTQIQKMGWWQGKTFKEYIRENLSIFDSGMSKDMKHVFQYVNIKGHAYYDITDSLPQPPQ